MNDQRMKFASSAIDIEQYRPGILVKWGSLFFLLIFLFVFLASWLVKYPDVIYSKGVLSTQMAPKPAVFRESGILKSILIVEDEYVEEGQVLGIIKSNTNYEVVDSLSQLLDSIQSTIINNGVELDLSLIEYDKLGSLEEEFSMFYNQYLEYKKSRQGGSLFLRLDLNKKELHALNEKYLYLKEIQDLNKENTRLIQEITETNTDLEMSQLVSKFDLNRSKMDYKNQQILYLNQTLALNDHKIMLLNKQKEIIELSEQIAQQKEMLLRAIRILISEIEEWETRYIVRAPTSGYISFDRTVEENQKVLSMDVLCFIKPYISDNYFIETTISQRNLGKIAIEQEVLIKFESYPWQEFGFLSGNVSQLLQVSKDSVFQGRISLNSLITSKGYEIKYQEGLIANAEIITKDRRLLERLFTMLTVD